MCSMHICACLCSTGWRMSISVLLSSLICLFSCPRWKFIPCWHMMQIIKFMNVLVYLFFIFFFKIEIKRIRNSLDFFFFFSLFSFQGFPSVSHLIRSRGSTLNYRAIEFNLILKANTQELLFRSLKSRKEKKLFCWRAYWNFLMLNKGSYGDGEEGLKPKNINSMKSTLENRKRPKSQYFISNVTRKSLTNEKENILTKTSRPKS